MTPLDQYSDIVSCYFLLEMHLLLSVFLLADTKDALIFLNEKYLFIILVA